MNDLPELLFAAAPAGGASSWTMFLFLGGFALIFYFMIFRPQSKRRKEHQALVSGLAKGDEVVTVGGIAGAVTKVEDDFVKVNIASNVEIRVQKSSVGASLPKGTLRSLEDGRERKPEKSGDKGDDRK